MSEFTVVGDPHIKPSNLETTAQLFDLVEGLSRPVIWLGDMLDTKEVVRSKCLNALYRYFKGSKLRHYVLVGNHDWHNLECEEHSLEILKELSNVHIIDKPTTFVNLPFLFMPYYHDLDKFKKDLAEYRGIGRDKASVLVMHQGINGFDFGNGYIEENGLDFSGFADFHRVISGHFHKFQEKGNLVYVGTPFSHSFGETDQDKFIALYDSASDSIEYVETPFPRHVTLELDAIWLTPDKIKGNNYYRVILTGPQADIEALDKSKFPGVKFIERPEELELEGQIIEESASNEKKFVTWAKEVRKLDKETVDLGLEIMGELS